MENKNCDDSPVFFPYYVNQPRLIDLYALLNGGYPEYEEIQTSSNEERKHSGKAGAQVKGNGFKILNLGGELSGSFETSKGIHSSSTARRVHTVTSMLSLALGAMSERKLIRSLNDCKAGCFVVEPVKLKVNSMKLLFSEVENIVELIRSAQGLSNEVDTSNKQNRKGRSNGRNNSNKAEFDGVLREVNRFSKFIGELAGSQEVICQRENAVLVGNISDDCFYQSSISDLIDTDFKCLAQVRRIFPEGTRLMKNSILSKLRDQNMVDSIVGPFSDLIKGDMFSPNATVVAEITGTPVYELEIVALYQDTPLNESK